MGEPPSGKKKEYVWLRGKGGFRKTPTLSDCRGQKIVFWFFKQLNLVLKKFHRENRYVTSHKFKGSLSHAGPLNLHSVIKTLKTSDLNHTKNLWNCIYTTSNMTDCHGDQQQAKMKKRSSHIIFFGLLLRSFVKEKAAQWLHKSKNALFFALVFALL